MHVVKYIKNMNLLGVPTVINWLNLIIFPDDVDYTLLKMILIKRIFQKIREYLPPIMHATDLLLEYTAIIV